MSVVFADTIDIYCPYCNHAGVEVLNESEGVCECGNCHRMMLVLNGNIYTDDDRQLLLLSYVIYPDREKIIANLATESDIGIDELRNAESTEEEMEADATSESSNTRDSDSTTTNADTRIYSAESENVESGNTKTDNRESSNVEQNDEAIKASVSQIDEKLKSSVSELNISNDHNSLEKQKVSTNSGAVFKVVSTSDSDDFRASDSVVIEKIDLVDTVNPITPAVIILALCILAVAAFVVARRKK